MSFCTIYSCHFASSSPLLLINLGLEHIKFIELYIISNECSIKKLCKITKRAYVL